MNRIACLYSAILLAFSMLSPAQTKPTAVGHWEGSISVPSTELRILVDLDRDASGNWIGDIDIPDQMAKDLPLKNISVSEDSVTFQLIAGMGDPTFKGKLSADGSTLSGEFIQAGSSVPCSLKRAGDPHVKVPVKIALLPEQLTGKWEGILDTPNGSLHLVFNLANKDGAGVGTIDSPDQGANGIPISEISVTEGVLRIGVQVVGGEYKGKLGDDSKTLKGDWSQAGSTFPLALKKAAASGK